MPSLLDAVFFLAREGLSKIASSTLLTLGRSLIGFLIAVIASLVLGLVYTVSDTGRSFVSALNSLLQSISVLVWVIVFVMFFGVLSPIPPVLVATIVSLPILLATIVGELEASRRKILELAKILEAPRLRLYTDFLLPSMAIALAASARAALGAALRISVVAEAFGSNGGIGYEIATYYSLAEPRGVFAWGLLLVVLMLAVDLAVLKPIEGRVKLWRVMV